MIRRAMILVVCGALLTPLSAQAQLGKLKDKVKQKVEAKVDKKIDCTLEKHINSKECEQARKESPAAAGATAPSGKPGEGAWANYDFVPGDRIMFAEDFTADRAGDFPRRLKFAEGVMEVVEWNGRRWLRNGGESGFSIMLPEALPERWTMEFEMAIPWNGVWIYPGNYNRALRDDNPKIYIYGNNIAVSNASGQSSSVDPSTVLNRKLFSGEVYLSPPVHFRVQADGDYMKVYLNEQRIANMPTMGRWTGRQLNFSWRDNTNANTQQYGFITNISINAGGKELYQKLATTGRVTVPGIYFDVGSDVIRPESSGTLAEIVELLKEHSELKLAIEGHTDNVGDANANKALSEARAKSVVAFLTSRGIDAARLSAAGHGDAKPAAPNDTPENRQKNRRVELVKQ